MGIKKGQKTIAQISREMSFEDIYDQMNKRKIHRDTIQRDISELVRQRTNLNTEINRLNTIALTKRRLLVNKK